MHESESLGVDFAGEKIDPGRVSTRFRQARDQAKLHRVFADAEYNRDRRRCGFGDKGGRAIGGRGNHSYAASDDVVDQRRQEFVMARKPVVLDDDILAIGAAGLT